MSVMQIDAVRAAVLLLCAMLATTLLPAPASAVDAVTLVTRDYFEGVPFDEARALTQADADLLVEMLSDPEEARHHAKIIFVLGVSARSGAYEAIAAYRAAEPQGAVGGDVFEVQLTLPIALGHLARSDDRALADLMRMSRGSGLPGWSYKRVSGQRLREMLALRCAQGLGFSGRPEARARLAALASEDSPSSERIREVSSALEVYDRIERLGRDRALTQELR